jgi:apolipoprotein N-acyltransferase
MAKLNKTGFGAKRAAPFLVCMALGAVAALGHAPFNLPIFTLIGFAAAGAVILAAPHRLQLAWRTWAMGLGYFAVSLSWLVEPFLVDISRHGWMAPFGIFLMAAGLSLLWALGAWTVALLCDVKDRWAGLFAALSAVEILRSWLFTGFPWANPGHVWIATPFAQAAAFIGASGLGAVTLFCAFGVAEITRGVWVKSRPIWGGGLAVLVVLITGATGLLAQFQMGKPLPEARNQIVRLVQPNAPQHLKWHPDHAYDFYKRQIELTAAPARDGARRPDVIVWPETAVPTLLNWADELLVEMTAAAQGTPLVFGIQRQEEQRYFNSLALLQDTGKVEAIYDKRHLVPFGEYIPFGDLLAKFGVTAFAAQAGNGFSAATGARLMDLGVAGKILPLICYEAIFARDIRSVPERADWILHATNDAWFGTFSMPYQHLAQVRFRAIEFGLPVVRVANTGVSAMIDVKGDIVAQIPLGQAGFQDVEIAGARPGTSFASWGVWPQILSLLLTISVLRLRAGAARKRH